MTKNSFLRKLETESILTGNVDEIASHLVQVQYCLGLKLGYGSGVQIVFAWNFSKSTTYNPKHHFQDLIERGNKSLG